jgi:hypothetical protein
MAPSNWVWAFCGCKRGVRDVAVLVLVDPIVVVVVVTYCCRRRYPPSLYSPFLPVIAWFTVASLINKFVSWVDEGEMGKNRPRQMSWPIIMMHYTGLPLHGSPLVFLHPKILRRVRSSRPHPSGKGRGGWGSTVCPRLLGLLKIRPTSLMRGEGPNSGSSRVVESKWVVREGGGVGGMSGERTNINRDGVDVRLKLRLPT